MLIVQGLIMQGMLPTLLCKHYWGIGVPPCVPANMLQVMECLNVVYAVLHYGPDIAATSCANCSAGQFVQEDGQSQCRQCHPGRIQLFTTAVKIAVQACTQTESTVRV